MAKISTMLVAFAAIVVAGCGSDAGERVAGGALMGGALGIPGGPIGVALGAGVGAAAGAFVPKEVLQAAR
jgi:hypothetical protein